LDAIRRSVRRAQVREAKLALVSHAATITSERARPGSLRQSDRAAPRPSVRGLRSSARLSHVYPKLPFVGVAPPRRLRLGNSLSESDQTWDVELAAGLSRVVSTLPQPLSSAFG